MSALPDAASLVHGTGLGSRSHLQRVLVSELARLATLGAPSAPSRALLIEPGPFEAALRRDARERGGAVIAEFKQASPSLGPFAMGTPLLAQLRAYLEGGAAAFSILAEPAYFMGSVEHLKAAAELKRPRLYKGFVIAEAQLAEAEAGGAEAVLLIARVLKEHTAAFAEAARARGLEPLVELHDMTEVGFAQAVLIRESGLATPEDARAALRAGFDAVLIGEALMRSPDPRDFLSRILAGLR